MTDEELVAALGAKPFELWERIPDAMRGVLLNIRFDRDALWRLPLSIEDVAVSELRWQLDLPWWRHEGRYFAVSPNAVRADPERYPVHWQRTCDADLSYPIHLLATTPVLRIFDGVHRLLKAELEGATTIRACRVDRDRLAQILSRR